jgi:hypothetical protein
MTTKKDFKRKVRDHAARTGRSYASARRLLLTRKEGDAPMTPEDHETHSFHRVDKPDLGFAVALPDGWSEFPRPFSDSPFEVARFACRDDVSHLCIVFRMPGSRDPRLRSVAERSRSRLCRRGYDNFAFTEVGVGGQPGLMLSFDKKTEEGVWCLGLASGDPARAASVFDGIASRFEVARMRA